jgi:hypothetical protein
VQQPCVACPPAAPGSATLSLFATGADGAGCACARLDLAAESDAGKPEQVSKKMTVQASSG